MKINENVFENLNNFYLNHIPDKLQLLLLSVNII